MPNQNLKDEILEKMMPNVPFDGWSWDGVMQACVDSGHNKAMALALFPEKISSVLSHMADMFDRQMLDRLGVSDENTRIRDVVAECCMARFAVMNDYKEQERLALQYWVRPHRKLHAKKILWRTADKIWTYAGDTSTDYNHYTKRFLLCGVLASTTLVWLNDDTNDLSITREFLDRRIDNVLTLGKPVGALMKRIIKS